MCDSTVYNPPSLSSPFRDLVRVPSLFLFLSFYLFLSLFLFLSLSLLTSISEYTTYTLPKLRTLSTLSSIFISVKYWLDFGKGMGEDLGSTNGGRRMDEKKKKKEIFGRSFDFWGDFFFFFSFFLFLSFLLFYYSIWCVGPPNVFVQISCSRDKFFDDFENLMEGGTWMDGWLNGEDVQSGRR